MQAVVGVPVVWAAGALPQTGDADNYHSLEQEGKVKVKGIKFKVKQWEQRSNN